MPKTFSIKTLGCKLNQYESAQLASRLLQQGWSAVEFGEPADSVIINTCTVTDRSDKKCRNYIRQGARFSNNGKVIVTGCLAERDTATLNDMKETLAVYPPSDHQKMIESICNRPQPDSDSTCPLPFKHTRGYIKIQDGCDGSCSYCIVPVVRGMPRSRPISEIIDHARRLIDAGCPEIIITGITIGKYEYQGLTIADVIKQLLSIDGAFRLRITSIEPHHLTEQLMRQFENPRLCRHLHLPLQSGSDRILRLMNRPYSISEYQAIITRIKTMVPDIAIGTDIIIGFPGETEDDFAGSLSLVRSDTFAYVHQFTFSSRSGTVASTMPQTTDVRAIQDRGNRLKRAAGIAAQRYQQRFIDTVRDCVIEDKKNNLSLTAVSDNYLKINITDTPATRQKLGSIAPVRIMSANGTEINGELII